MMKLTSVLLTHLISHTLIVAYFMLGNVLSVNMLFVSLSYFFLFTLSTYCVYKRYYFLYFVNTVFLLKYTIVPFMYAAHENYITAFGFDMESIFPIAVLYIMAMVVAINTGFIFSSYYKEPIEFELKMQPMLLQILVLFLFSTLVFYKILNFNQDFANRLNENKGTGPLQIIAFMGYYISIYFISRFQKEDIGISILITAFIFSVLGGVYFMLLGYRGGFLYSSIIFIAFYNIWLKGRYYLLGFVPAIFALIFEVNYATGALRQMVVTGSSFTFEEFSNFYINYKNKYTVPLAFSHFELISYWLSKDPIDEVLLGSYNTIHSSFLNWLPSNFVSNKDLTTGARIAVELYPGVVTSEGRTSSMTTGIIFESLYNFGVLFGFLFIFLFYFFVGKLLSLSRKFFNVEPMAFIMYFWLFAMSLYFDDLGGAINKFVIITISFAFIHLFRMVLYR